MQEMYYRHLYATVQPTLEQRCESWDNYCALFNIILTSSINMQVRIFLHCSPCSIQAPATCLHAVSLFLRSCLSHDCVFSHQVVCPSPGASSRAINPEHRRCCS